MVFVQRGSFKSSRASAVILSAMQPVPPSDIPSLAVLPFTNLTGDPKEYFSDGITDELITMLSRLSNLLSSLAPQVSPAKTSRQRRRISAGSWG
jgi:TolB-like protein